MPRQLKVHGHISAVFEALYRMSQNMQCCRPLDGVGGGVGVESSFFYGPLVGAEIGIGWVFFVFFFTPCYFEVDQIRKFCKCPCML